MKTVRLQRRNAMAKKKPAATKAAKTKKAAKAPVKGARKQHKGNGGGKDPV